MRVLDCESIESIYSSLESIISIDRKQLKAAFAKIYLEKLPAPSPESPCEYDKQVFILATGSTPETVVYDRVCWFHLSRVPDPTCFEKGLLPLGNLIDSIWETLWAMVPKSVTRTEWDDFRMDLGPSNDARQYRNKSKNQLLWGPYAILIRDYAFHSKKVGSHDYLQVPEIVEDICLAFRERNSIDLLAKYTRRTKPCIVKFWDADAHPGCLVSAVYHAYSTYRGYELDSYGNLGFDGGGKPVSPQQIISIEKVRKQKHRM